MIVLTRQWTDAPKARAVPGAYWDRDVPAPPGGRRGAWVLYEPTARAAAVALQLFPALIHEHPELEDLRASMYRDARPVDYATQLAEQQGLGAVRYAWGELASRVTIAMQERGWHWHDYQCIDLWYGQQVLEQHGGFYIGWDRGKGKTLATAGLIDALDCQATLVVAPNSAKSVTWADELAWACRWVVMLVLPNDKAKRERCLEAARDLHTRNVPFVLVVHYEALAVIAGKQPKRGKNGSTLVPAAKDGWRKLGIVWDLIVADEGHRLANYETLQARAIARIPSKRRLVLSGSVFQNRYEEMFGPLHWLFPDRYKALWRDWVDRYVDYVENGYGRICIGLKPERAEALRDELGRFMVYREKENLAIPSTVKVSLSGEQRRVYDELAETCLAELPDGTTVKAQVGVAMLTRLRQVATGLELVPPHRVTDSSKLDAAIDVIEQRIPEGDDFVVFTWYKQAADALAERLAALGIESWMIHGDVPQKDRTEAIRRFQAGERRVMIGSIATMGESVNLQRANHVIRIDRSFNPALNQQAVDRVDRQGQKRDVYLTDIVAEDTVDEYVVMPRIANKEALRAIIFGQSKAAA